ncbi:MAG: peptidylprolyl isomerase [Gammaproteobacteria bacterium]
MKKSKLLALLAGVFCTGATLAATSTELDRIVAVVEEDVIMQSELDEQMQRVRDALREQGTEMPPTTVLERQVMERLVLEKIQLQLADRAGVIVEDAMLDQAVADIAQRNNLSLDQFQEILRSEGYEFDRFKEQIRQEIVIAKLRREEVDNRIKVTDNEVDNYLRGEQIEEEGLEYRLFHILIATPPNADNDTIRAARTKAADTLLRLQAGEDFRSVAISVSDGQQALEGGDLGWRKGRQIPSLFADSVSTMQPGDISSIITSPSGFHIIQLADKRSGETIMVEQYKVRHILLKPNELVSPDMALNRLKQIRLRIDSGADFARLARTNSDDRGSALQGGELGWVSKGQMVPEFEEVMLAMNVGELSQPFRTEFGYHILQVMDKREYDGTEEVKRDRARQAIRQQKIDERRQSWLRRLRDEAYVEYRLDE